MRRDERGFALLDVLLGMFIFAIVVLVAIQAIMDFKLASYELSVKNDAKLIAVTFGGAQTVGDGLPDPGTGVGKIDTSHTLAAHTSNLATLHRIGGANLTARDLIWSYTVLPGGEYELCVVHATRDLDGSAITAGETDAWALYESAKGKTTEYGRGPGATCS